MERKIEKEVLKNIEDWKKWNEKHLKSVISSPTGSTKFSSPIFI